MDLVTKLYNGLSSAVNVNKSTLSGAMDVIAVVDDDRNIKTTPFHVRFGKFRLIKPKEKLVCSCGCSLTDVQVEIRVNGKLAPFHMYLDEEGEAYFARTVPGVSKSKSPGAAMPPRSTFEVS